MSQAALLARRLQQNWLDRHPHDTCGNGINLDDSLTSLGWLQNLRVAEFAQSRQVPNNGAKLDSSRNSIKQEFISEPATVIHMQYQDLEQGIQTADTRVPPWRNPYVSCELGANDDVKPPYSYARLICMAMKATGKSKITLASIYSWITENFEYYRLSDPSWQNSIRHNLSLNKCFEKVPRRKDEPGKGGFWRIKPEYTELMESSLFKKRGGSGDTTPSPPLKRVKLEDYRLSDMRRAREDKLLSNCIGDFELNEEDSENSLTLKDDLNWTNLLNQDIEIGGQTIKTEALLDECENSSFGSLSPRCAEPTSDFLGIDFLTQTNFTTNIPLELQPNFPLDLTVQGTTIRRPDWWTTDDNNNMLNVGDSYRNNIESGLNTPSPPSTEPEHGEIIWGENLKLDSSGSSFDLESLFSFDKMPSSKELN